MNMNFQLKHTSMHPCVLVRVAFAKQGKNTPNSVKSFSNHVVHETKRDYVLFSGGIALGPVASPRR